MQYINSLKEEFDGFSSIRLINATRNVLEKLLWLTIAVAGTIWIGDLFITQISYWNENPILSTRGSKALSDIKAPAITFCHKGTLKYSIVEKLVNYINIDKTIPIEIFQIRNEAIKTSSRKIGKDWPGGRSELCKIRREINGNWILSDTDANCNEFSKKLYILSKKNGLNLEQIHEMVFDLIVQHKLWNLTDAVQKLEKALDYQGVEGSIEAGKENFILGFISNFTKKAVATNTDCKTLYFLKKH